ncbi:MAG: NUDIX hydrolase [Gammaproteobacteria bacterium]|nr:NUDIX hydrolase [Gammaproteobacteria bacterium]
MKFCSECGGPVIHRIPEGDNLPRHICEACDLIHYQNPKIVTGCLPVWNKQVLLCKRAIEPCYGLWTLPAGFMENQESLEEAAIRESREEANANLKLESLYSVISLPHINQVYVMYRATLLDLDFYAGPESLDVRLFNEEDIPWELLAFKTIEKTLRRYFEDRKKGKFNVYNSVISKRNRLGEKEDIIR